MNSTDLPDAGHAPRKGWPVSSAVAALLFALVAPIAHHTGEQQASRYSLTASLWDYGTVEIDRFEDFIGRDRAIREGVIYSDKAPGQPFLAVPFYGIYRVAGGDSMIETRTDPLAPDAGLWWMTLWSAFLPGCVLAVLMYRWAEEVEPRTALGSVLAMSLGTLLLVYSGLLFGHVLAAVLAFGMFLIVREPDRSALALATAGSLGGAAVITEFPAALVVIAVGVIAVFIHRRRVWALLAGALPFAVFGAWYNFRVTGSPIVTAFQWSAFSGPRSQHEPLKDVFAGASWDRLLDVLFSERGLLIGSPVLLLALAGIWLLFRRGRRVDASAALGAIVLMVAVQVAWANSYAGGAGPRYVVPALPFMAAPVAVAWERWRRAGLVLGGIGVLTMMAAFFTEPQLGSDFSAGLGDWLATALAGDFAPNWLVIAFGPVGWMVHVAFVGVAIMLLANARRDFRERTEPDLIAVRPLSASPRGSAGRLSEDG